jgi:molecular chaperone DnaK
MVQGNKSLGRFQLTGIAPAPRGMPQVEVTFDIDANGILNVSAKDNGTGRQQTVQIQSGGGLSDQEIKQMVQDAEKNAGDDRKARALAEARNVAEQTIYQTDRQLEESKEAVLDGDLQQVMSLVGQLKHAIEGEDLAAIQGATEALQGAWAEVSERIHSRAEAQHNISQREASEDADIIDAEVVE